MQGWVSCYQAFCILLFYEGGKRWKRMGHIATASLISDVMLFVLLNNLRIFIRVFYGSHNPVSKWNIIISWMGMVLFLLLYYEILDIDKEINYIGMEEDNTLRRYRRIYHKTAAGICILKLLLWMAGGNKLCTLIKQKF